MLGVKRATGPDKQGPAYSSWKPKLQPLLSSVGLGLLVLSGGGWLLVFPTLNILSFTLSGDRTIFHPGQPLNPVAGFFHEFPQLLWLGFTLGAGLYFAFRSAPPAAGPVPAVDPVVAGRGWRVPAWAYPTWRGAGVVALLAVLVLAASLRIGNAREIGATDLVRTDYDEGVHASAALLMGQGKRVYQDYFLTQPPVGPFIWSLPLRWRGSAWGGLNEFLLLRFVTSLLSLGTIAMVYLTGCKLGGRWAGPLAGSIAALTLAIDGSAVRTEQQIMLEPLVNFFSAAAMLTFVHTNRAPGRRQLAQLALAGGLAGVAFSIKIPALAVVMALGLTLVIWRQWRAMAYYGAGVLAGYLLPSAAFVLTSGTSLIKQVYLYQLLRPFNNLALVSRFESETTLTAFEYLSRTPYLAFSLLAAGLGLAGILTRWATRHGAEQWLPVTLMAVFTALLYTGKAGFFPHYYDHLALPLALMAGGIVNLWRPEWWRGIAGAGLSAATLVLALWLGWPLARLALEEPSQPTWSLERAVSQSFDNLDLPDGSVLTWDARYSFILGEAMPTDRFNKYLVDSAAYVEYLGLGLEGKNMAAVINQAIVEHPKPNQDLRQLRYTPLVQNTLYDLASQADYVLVEPRAESQLTEQTRRLLKQSFINRLDTPEIDLFSNSRSIANKSGALFGGQMRLVGFDAPRQFKPRAGSLELPLTLFWRGEQKILEDYVIFIHLLNEAGEKVAQRDTAPRNGSLDTSRWNPGELLDDNQSLPIATNLAPGRYKIMMGVYRPTDGSRLKVTQAPPGQEAAQGDSLILAEVNILGL